MKFPKVSGKVVAAVVIILIILYFFRREEGYVVDQSSLMDILNDPSIVDTLSDDEKNTIVTAINESPTPSLPATLQPILNTRPMVRDNLAKLLETSKPQPARQVPMGGPMGGMKGGPMGGPMGGMKGGPMGGPMGGMRGGPVGGMRGGPMGGMPRGFSCQFNN